MKCATKWNLVGFAAPWPASGASSCARTHPDSHASSATPRDARSPYLPGRAAPTGALRTASMNTAAAGSRIRKVNDSVRYNSTFAFSWCA